MIFFGCEPVSLAKILEKFVINRVRVAILGDISHQVSESAALRDFVYETNQGHSIWFVRNLDELGTKLRSAGSINFNSKNAADANSPDPNR